MLSLLLPALNNNSGLGGLLSGLGGDIEQNVSQSSSNVSNVNTLLSVANSIGGDASDSADFASSLSHSLSHSQDTGEEADYIANDSFMPYSPAPADFTGNNNNKYMLYVSMALGVISLIIISMSKRKKGSK